MNNSFNNNSNIKKNNFFNIFMLLSSISFIYLFYYLSKTNPENTNYKVLENSSSIQQIDKIDKIDKTNKTDKIEKIEKNNEKTPFLLIQETEYNINQLEKAIQYNNDNKKFVKYLEKSQKYPQIDGITIQKEDLNQFLIFVDKQIDYFQEQTSILKNIINSLKQNKIDKEEVKNEKKILFKDIYGLTNVKEELEDLIYFFQDKNTMVNAHKVQPKGYLLWGPPGTGKTFIIKAFCNEAGVHFIELDPSIFNRKFVGEGEEVLNKIWKEAESHEKSIIFIDEINGFVNRSSLSDNKSSVNIINNLLIKLDGHQKSNKKIIVMGATNFLHQVDAALLNRFSQQIFVGFLKNEEIEGFLKHIIVPYAISFHTFIFLKNIANDCKNQNNEFSKYSNRILKDIIDSAYKKTIKYNFKNKEHEVMLPSDLEEVMITKKTHGQYNKEDLEERKRKREEEYFNWKEEIKKYLQNNKEENK
ncbi:AAA family ATPase [Candidatus Phytoplasma oryzae]|nr:AAA family ATPase [Candidatus Phytoplasma oryzae]